MKRPANPAFLSEFQMPDDPQQEWQRLGEVYGSMSDDELLRIADDRENLTESASQVLAVELKKRQLSDPFRQTVESPGDTTESSVEELTEGIYASQDAPADLVELAQFRFPAEGELAKATLDSAEIESWVFDGTMSRYLGAGVRICVKPQDAEAALQILSQPIPESIEVEGLGTFEQPRCPNCNSLNISYGTAIYEGMMDRELLADNQWVCHECDARWDEEEGKTDLLEEEKEEPQP